MKTQKIIMGVAALLIACVVARGAEITVEVGDRPYYTEGRSYWDSGYEYVWGPGHWGPHHHWVHGAYAKHGEVVKEHLHDHHHVKWHDDDHH
jgi:hypothetical protein